MARLERSSNDRVISGVAAGLANYANMDPALVRFLLVVAALMTAGTAVPMMYLIAWAVLPDQATGRREIDDLLGKKRRTIPGQVIPPQQKPWQPPAQNQQQQPYQPGKWQQPPDTPIHNADDLR